MINCGDSQHLLLIFFFFNDTATTEIYTLSLHDALPILIFVFLRSVRATVVAAISIPLSLLVALIALWTQGITLNIRSEEHTSELQSRPHIVCRLLLVKTNTPDYDESAIALQSRSELG